MNSGFVALTNVVGEIIAFLGLGAYIAGLVVCIIYRNVSKAMILCIVGFGGLIGLYVLEHLVGALGAIGGMGQEMFLAYHFFRTLLGLLGPVSTALLVFGLYRVFSDVRGRRPRRLDTPRRRDEGEYDVEEVRPVPRPRRPGDGGIRR